MGKILSQEEIDSFLTAPSTIDSAPDIRPSKLTSDAVVYDFRRPDRVSKEQISSLHFLYDRFTRNATNTLSAFLRIATDMTVVSVEQLTYSEVLMSLPDPTAFYAVGLSPLDGVAALELNPDLAFPMIDRMLGGRGNGPSEDRALTDIEQHVVDDLVHRLLEQMTEVWRSVFEVRFTIKGRETRPQMLQIAGPNEPVVLLVCDVRLPEARGMINFVMPAAAVEQTGTSVVRSWQQTHKERTLADQKRLYSNLSRVALTATASLETLIPATDALQFEPGDVLTLGRQVKDPLELRLGRSLKFVGIPTVSGESAAIGLTACVDRGESAEASV
jgi:flagellar motor switch protein FliM